MKKQLFAFRGYMIFCICFSLLAVVPAMAGEFSVTLLDNKGAAAGDGVVSLTPKNASRSLPPVPLAEAVMDQVDKEFVPHVLPVRTGTRVRFPNSDNIRHHVYSFSKPKIMELKLYARGESNAVVFDKPGVVVLGCNIHDWMVGYIYVVDAPYFAKSGADGKAVVTGVPSGGYEMQVWHPRLKGKPLKQDIDIPATGSASLEVRLPLKKKRKSKRHRQYKYNQNSYK
jgi:plastocyanin